MKKKIERRWLRKGDHTTFTHPASSVGLVNDKHIENIDHPAHYGGANNTYEAIKVIEAWGLGFCLGNTIKYICRAGKKDPKLSDLRKALWYLNREIERLSSTTDTSNSSSTGVPTKG